MTATAAWAPTGAPTPAPTAADVGGPYAGAVVAMATRHGKQRQFRGALRDILGASLVLADVDTDQLGTFAGDIPRRGTPLEVATAKARLGMAATGLSVGLATEGSFGPHPTMPWATLGVELGVWVDDRLGMVVAERTTITTPVLSSIRTTPDGADGSAPRLLSWLEALGFGSHAGAAAVLVTRGDGVPAPHVKGVVDEHRLRHAVRRCAAASVDGHAVVAPDLRAHTCPPRQAALATLAERLARRVGTACPACGAPGWGPIAVSAGRPCRCCGRPTMQPAVRTHGCTRCAHRHLEAVGPRLADPACCPHCNP